MRRPQTPPVPSCIHAFVLSARPHVAGLHTWLANTMRTCMDKQYTIDNASLKLDWDETPPTFVDSRFAVPLSSVGVLVQAPRPAMGAGWVDSFVDDVQQQFSNHAPLDNLFLIARYSHPEPTDHTTVVESQLVFSPIPGVGHWVKEPVSHHYLVPKLNGQDWREVWNTSVGLDAAFKVLLNRHLGGGWEHVFSQHRQQALELVLPGAAAKKPRVPRF